MKNLISMVDFVLEHSMSNKTILNRYSRINNYAKFLKQPLELWMFVPCDENGNVLEESGMFKLLGEVDNDLEQQRYQQAKERCLFDDFEMDNSFVTHKSHSSFFYPKSLLHEKTIEDLVKYNLKLTPPAIKQIGL